MGGIISKIFGLDTDTQQSDSTTNPQNQNTKKQQTTNQNNKKPQTQNTKNQKPQTQKQTKPQTQNTKNPNTKNQQKTQTTKPQNNKNQTLTEDEKAILDLCASGKIELEKIAEELVKADITMDDALKWYLKSLDYVKCSNCDELITKIEKLYLDFIALKLASAINDSKLNREEIAAKLPGTLKITDITSFKNKLQNGQNVINNIITSAPESLGISTKEARAKVFVNNFDFSSVDIEIDYLNNMYIILNNMLMETFKNKELQEVKKFFELVLIGTETCIPQYYERNNAINNPGNILISEIISLQGYKQLLRFAPLQPLLMFHDATNNPLLNNLQITDKFICDYLGIEKTTTTIKESPQQVEILDNGTTYTFQKSGNEIVGSKLSYRKDIYQQNIPYFITKAGFAIDLGIYNNACHTLYYTLSNADSFSIMKVYEIEGKKYILQCETNTWCDVNGLELSAEQSQYFNNPSTEKVFISQTNIIVHKEAKDKDNFTVNIDFEVKKGDVANNISKQYLMNLIAYYFHIIFGNGGYVRKEFSDVVGLTKFMNEETKDYNEFFTKGTTILQNIWRKYPEHLLSLCAYANKILPDKINYKLPINYPRFGNSETAASKFIMNKIIKYTSYDSIDYFETVDFSIYPYSTEPWDIVKYPVSTDGMIYNFKVLTKLTKTYDNRFDFLFNQTSTNEISEFLNISASDILNPIDLTEFEHKNQLWNIADVLNDQSLSMFMYSKFIVAATRWKLILPLNTQNSTIFINKTDKDNGCPEKNLLAFLLTPPIVDGAVDDKLMF